MKRITPEIISFLSPDEVFVFGSNLQGKHECGAAKTAFEKFGAKMGVGLGLQGQSYAIPTINGDLSSIESYVRTFILYAKNNHKTRFYVTPIGCGIAGYTPEQIAPLFIGAIDCDNIFLPNSFWRIIEKKKRKEKYKENIHETNYVLKVSNSTGIRTSNYPYFCVDIQVLESNLVVSSGIANRYISLCTIIKDNTNVIVEKDYIDGNNQFVKKLPSLNYHFYTLDLYFQKDRKGFYYRQLSIPINIERGLIKLGNSAFLKNNFSFYKSIPHDSVFLKEATVLTAVVPGALLEFKDLAHKITKYDSSEYNSLLSVHDWVAKNIYYDYDSLNDGSYKNTPIEKIAITTLRTRKSVCQGFTDLSIALLRSIGIPSIGINCWAIGESDDKNALKNNESNHIFTAAYIDRRWILCDITWDSRNRYEKDSFDEDKKISHTYFDTTLEFISCSHKLIGYL